MAKSNGPAGINDELVFLPLGGTGEIGMNFNLYGYGPAKDRKWLAIDLGITFPDATEPGIDVITPDPMFIEGERDNLLGLVLTHAHEDHIGAVPHLWERLKCPLYATPFTAAMLRGKLAEHGLLNDVPLHEIPLGGHLTLGPFEMQFVTLTHSIPEPNAIAIRTPLGNVMHTGDWKIDDNPLIGDTTDIATLKAFGDEGVRAIVCDSTNVLSPGRSGSEADVRKNLTALIGTLTGRVAVTTFASNLARLATIMEAAAANDRSTVLVGRSMHKITAAARETGYLKGIPLPVAEDDAGYLPPDNVLYLCTGSQGEARAALSRIADDSHRHISLSEGDTVIFSSKIIPGNELPIFELHNRLSERGIDVLTEKDHDVHVSGHPCRDELTMMYQWIRPELSIPVHGEPRHLLAHAELAEELQVPEQLVLRNGLMARIAPGPAEVIDDVPAGRLHLDGRILVRAGEAPLRERRQMSFAGNVVVSLVVDDDGQLLADADVAATGIPDLEDDLSIEDTCAEAAEDAVNRMRKSARRDDDAVAEAARRAVRGRIRFLWDKKPPVRVLVTRV
ncbi:Metallo-beta-lactamase family protein,RNA-specific [Candidatus Phaeomarinobacter ectocarpi]|uniref:Metallo-beta-lactamase family protein,RNA-specific n=1 Tax=Candidatus Phaeomarinibacter ectocarpi TaxID=1458461 RepID=X5MH71_9HYPH|nr:ribonuclease J [Candidatus Phaeomarinobacter ectocarpi]CDO60984.1 Metallo-beta-lactamase family protein,RNA-specific [Candidatus Phaeomarinobacter ectocarpi]